MSNLEESIAEWRRQMIAAGVKTPVPLEELESHLRADFRALVAAGTPEAHALQLAVSRLGNPASVKTEFNKITRTQIRPVKIGSLLWLAGTIVLAVHLSGPLFHGNLNPLLYGNILSFTAGYGAAFLAGAFGICYVCYRSFHSLSPDRQQSLARAVYLCSHLAAGLVAVGWIFGMLWSRQHFGRYLGGEGPIDPREIGGGCGILWLIALTVIQRLDRVGERIRMLMCVGGNMVVSLAWFVPFVIARNLGWHGSSIGKFWPLAVFLGIHLCFLVRDLTFEDDGGKAAGA